MDKTDDLADYNLVDPKTGAAYNAPNKGDEDLSDEDDCSFDDLQKEQHQAEYGDSVFYEPYVTKPPGTATGTAVRAATGSSQLGAPYEFVHIGLQKADSSRPREDPVRVF